MPLISVAEAHARLIALVARRDAVTDAVTGAVTGIEEVPLAAAAGRVLARDVTAARAQPPFRASAMDGYAVRAADLATGARLRVIGEAPAGRGFAGRVGAGEAVRIFTGAPVPEGADAILIQEDAEPAGDRITVREGRDRAAYVRPAGADFAAGAVMSAPRRLGARDAALLAAMNVGFVPVARRPEVALIATGDELVSPGEAPGSDQIVASNTYGLKAMLEGAGARVRLLPIARDTEAALGAVLGLAADADLVVTLGGASVGDHDLVRQVALAHGLALDFYKVAMRPGKPLMAGRLGPDLGGGPLIGLPGNPVSAMVCGQLFVVPAVEAMLGLEGGMAVPLPARLEAALEANGPRAHYMRAVVTAEVGRWRCRPLPRQDSALLSVLAEANALAVRPPHAPAALVGDAVEFIWLT